MILIYPILKPASIIAPILFSTEFIVRIIFFALYIVTPIVKFTEAILQLLT